MAAGLCARATGPERFAWPILLLGFAVTLVADGHYLSLLSLDANLAF